MYKNTKFSGDQWQIGSPRHREFFVMPSIHGAFTGSTEEEQISDAHIYLAPTIFIFPMRKNDYPPLVGTLTIDSKI